MEYPKHLIIITHGVEDGLRQIEFGINYALTLRNMNIDTTIFLTGAGVKWANKQTRKRVHDIDFCAMQQNLSAFVEAGGKLLVCNSCYGDACNIGDHDHLYESLIDGVELVGLAKIAELSLDCKVVSF